MTGQMEMKMGSLSLIHILLTGGGALLDGLEEVISERTGINTMTAENPASVVALGTGEYVEIMADFERR